MLYKADFERYADSVSKIGDYDERLKKCEELCEKFLENNSRFFVPLFRHACRVEFIPKDKMQDAMIRHRMMCEEDGSDNWYIMSLEDHIMYNPYLGDSWNLPKKLKEKYPRGCRKINRSMVNGFYWNHGSTRQNKFEMTQEGMFLSDDEIQNERFADEPVKDKDYTNYDPYYAEFCTDG